MTAQRNTLQVDILSLHDCQTDYDSWNVEHRFRLEKVPNPTNATGDELVEQNRKIGEEMLSLTIPVDDEKVLNQARIVNIIGVQRFCYSYVLKNGNWKMFGQLTENKS